MPSVEYPNLLFTQDVRAKIRSLPMDIQAAWKGEAKGLSIPIGAPGRDIAIVGKGRKGIKHGLSTAEGQARLLHDLASIELQAMELAYRSFVEYPNAPKEFREQMAELALSEASHLELCLDQLENLGFQWGDWLVYLSLWNSVAAEDSLLDRILIVHRYLEASGLDAGVSMLKKLAQSEAPGLEKAVRVIATEEVDHVAFGSRWYKKFCADENLDPDEDFKTRLQSLSTKLPKRFEVIDPDVRTRAGFTPAEIRAAQDLREKFWREKLGSR
jgi:uncharacterized ferritin-like protein (DUF455 family)